jgi:hypothetical protein
MARQAFSRRHSVGILAALLAATAFLSSTCGVQAAIVTYGSSTGLQVATGPIGQTGQSEINAAILQYLQACCPELTDAADAELYKQDVGDPESGDFASSYTTAFDTPNDPEDANITYTGGDKILTECVFALVKDGNHDPTWYLFDISDWDRDDTLVFSDFWVGQGAISHISLYGCDNLSNIPGVVPEPVSAAIWALGLGIAGVFSRRRVAGGGWHRRVASASR